MKRLAVLLLLFASPAFALEQQQQPQQQQPTVDDMRAAYETAVKQRNAAQNEAVELTVGAKRAIDAYEARLATAMEWLKAAQSAQIAQKGSP